MERDFESKGALLIKTRFGDISTRNFSISLEDMAINQSWRDAVGAEDGVFCLVPEELDIAF